VTSEAANECRRAAGGYAVSEARIPYTAWPDATLEGERETLASIYAFVLQSHQERQKATLSKRDEDVGSASDRSGAAPVTRA
jgi:hypothetical protein